jgi:hypothetical protein
MDDHSQAQKSFPQRSPTELLDEQTKALSLLVEIQRKQDGHITKLTTQNERMIQLLSDLLLNETTPQDDYPVTIENFNMPFLDLVGILVKISLAAIPAAIVIAMIYFLVVTFLGAVFS